MSWFFAWLGAMCVAWSLFTPKRLFWLLLAAMYVTWAVFHVGGTA
jgi:hypothetical protein